MPKQTFFNLPESKRERITEAAIKEFAEYHPLDASINRIIEQANVSRGSFYQYFEDIEDLYKYIFLIVAEQKEAYMNESFQGKWEDDIFTVLRSMYKSALQFAKAYPLYAKIGNHLMKGDRAFKQRIIGEWEEYSKQYLIELLKKGQEEGTVRRDINLEVAAFLFYQQSILLTDNYLYAMEGKWTDHIDEFMQASNEMLNIFSKGIRAE